MTAEEGAPSMPIRIDECVAPERIAVSAGEGAETWTLYGEVRVDASGAEGGGGAGSVLALSQEISDPEQASAIGPGWEFYIDRLVAAETGGDPAEIDFDAYYPAQADYYRGLLG